MPTYGGIQPNSSSWDSIFERMNVNNDPKSCINLIIELLEGDAPKGIAKTGLYSWLFGNEAQAATPTEAEVTFAIKPSPVHWFHTISCSTRCRGGAAGLKVLRMMREDQAIGGGELTPNQSCYGVVVNALIDEDKPELISDSLLMMIEDNVTLDGSITDKMKQMRRYDVILEVMEQKSLQAK